MYYYPTLRFFFISQPLVPLRTNSDESEAQTECKRAFEAAIQVDPTNPQAHLTAADYYTVTDDQQAALDSIQHCLDLWWPKLENFLNDCSARRSAKEAESNISELDEAGDDTTTDGGNKKQNE
ncbi:hypothetical protein FGIG_12506 [Fasciola gigantica]|uniref:Uncharacterized protein n=1 Tax=Fasciola gigantica TaxID=46835 RepID=A0A504YYD6_FASGI|nr:hypothetical protein FGIG_12506 [Fasciola gigantica]